MLNQELLCGTLSAGGAGTHLRATASALVSIVNAAIDARYWDVDEGDPKGMAGQLTLLMRTNATGHQIAKCVHDLVTQCMVAIASGRWMVGASDIDVVFDADMAIEGMVAANDDPGGNALAI